MNSTFDSGPSGFPTISSGESVVPVVRPTQAPPVAGIKPHPAKPDRNTLTIWDVPFDRLTMPESVDAIGKLIASGQPSYAITANLNYCMLHGKDAAVCQVTADADLVLADGQPIVWRSFLEEDPLPTRVAGSEMIIHLCERAARDGWRVYFLGGAEGVAQNCAERLQAKFPALQIAGAECPPFRQLSDQEHADQLARIRDSKTDLLLVAFGQPKGEKWIHENLRSLGNACCIQVGASFDFVAGTSKRAPEGFQRFGMEWAFRMMSDPKRLVPRYASNAWFLAQALVNDWRTQVKRWGMWD